ncbi:MAG: Hsp70 family protein [Acidimicrobiales bacterium]
MEYGLGIDFGTTYCAAAVSTARGAEICTLGTRAATIPSVVFVRGPGDVLVGDAAERRALDEPGRAAAGFKRRLGDPTPLVLGGSPYGAETLTAHVLSWIVAQVSQQQGAPPSSIVLTHPAPFGAYKIDLLRLAAQQADIGPVSFVTEPEAAAVHYATLERIEVGQVVAVYDFGGGTFDAALLRRTADGFTGLGHPEGLERMGGIDLDHAVLQHVIDALGLEPSELVREHPDAAAALARVRDDCRAAKEALSSDADVTIPVSLPGLMTQVRLTRVEFEAMIRPRILDTIDALQRAVRSAGLGMDDVARILLVGGTSRIPLVREMVHDVTGRPATVDVHPKHSVALGAASLAAARAGVRALPPPPAAAAPPPVSAAAAAAAAPFSGPPTASTPPAPPALPTTTPGQGSDPSPEPHPEPAATGRRTGLIASGVLAVIAVVVIGVLVTRGGDDGDASPDTTVPATDLAAVGDEPLDPTTVPATDPAAAPTTSATAAAGDATELEPFAGTLPRATTYANLSITVTRLVIRRVDPVSYLGGLESTPDAPPYAYLEVTSTNGLSATEVDFADTAYDLRLADGTSLPATYVDGASSAAPGATVATVLAFGLPEGTPLDAAVFAGAVLEVSDADDQVASVPLDGDPATPPADLPVTMATTLAVADADGNTVQWNVGDGTLGLDAAYESADAPYQRTDARRAATDHRWLNVPLSIVAGSCTCGGFAVDSTMVRVLVGDTPIEAENAFGEYLSPDSTFDTILTFSVPATPGPVVLRIGPVDRADLQQSITVDLP